MKYGKVLLTVVDEIILEMRDVLASIKTERVAFG